MNKYVVTQKVTITYLRIVEAEGLVDALDKVEGTDLDEWKEIDVESDDSIYVREFEEGDKYYE
jgi:hypothetical protein